MAASFALFESRAGQAAVTVAMESVPQDAAAASAAVAGDDIAVTAVDTSSTLSNIAKVIPRVAVILKDGSPGPGVTDTASQSLADYVGTGGARQYDIAGGVPWKNVAPMPAPMEVTSSTTSDYLFSEFPEFPDWAAPNKMEVESQTFTLPDANDGYNFPTRPPNSNPSGVVYQDISGGNFKFLNSVF